MQELLIEFNRLRDSKIISQVCFSVWSSPEIVHPLQRVSQTLVVTKKNHIKNLTLKEVCETSWVCRIQNVKAVRFQYAEILKP
jgi:hypothetical protein